MSIAEAEECLEISIVQSSQFLNMFLVPLAVVRESRQYHVRVAE